MRGREPRSALLLKTGVEPVSDEVKPSSYLYSRSVTLRAYGFLLGFAGWALWLRLQEAPGEGTPGGASSPLTIVLLTLAIATFFLIRWRSKRLLIEFLGIALAVAALYPVFRLLSDRADTQLAQDVVHIGTAVLALLAVFAKLPAPSEAPHDGTP